MKYILDTVTLLYLVTDQQNKIPKKVVQKIRASTELYLSVASTWEMAIKSSIGRLIFHQPMEVVLTAIINKMNLETLPILNQHAIRISQLPFYHKDPFDRLIIAQSQIEDIPIITPDKFFKKYDVNIVW